MDLFSVKGVKRPPFKFLVLYCVLGLCLVIFTVWMFYPSSTSSNANNSVKKIVPNDEYKVTKADKEEIKQTVNKFLENATSAGPILESEKYDSLINVMRNPSEQNWLTVANSYRKLRSTLAEGSPLFIADENIREDLFGQNTTVTSSFSVRKASNVDLSVDDKGVKSTYHGTDVVTVKAEGYYQYNEITYDYLNTEAGGEEGFNKTVNVLPQQRFTLEIMKIDGEWKVYNFETKYMALLDLMKGKNLPALITKEKSTIYPVEGAVAHE